MLLNEGRNQYVRYTVLLNGAYISSISSVFQGRIGWEAEGKIGIRCVFTELYEKDAREIVDDKTISICVRFQKIDWGAIADSDKLGVGTGNHGAPFKLGPGVRFKGPGAEKDGKMRSRG